MTTVAQIITRALRPMRDADQTFFPDAELIEYINEAVEDLASRQRLFHEEDTSCVTTGGNIPFANIGSNSDIVNIRWVVNPDGVQASWLDASTFKEYQYAYLTWDEDVPLASVWDEVIHLHPSPADGEVWTVGYYALPAILSTDSDTFPLSRVFERKVTRFVRAQCYYRLGEAGFGDRDMADYNEGLRPADRAYDRNMPGFITLSREGNVFDIDTESIHQG